MLSITNNQIRQFIRNYIRYIRKNLTQYEQHQASKKILKHIINDYRIQQAHRIGLFISFDGEIQTHFLIKKLLYMGKKIYFPILPPCKTSKKLLFSQYITSTNLILNSYKIYEPKLNIKHLIPINKLNIIFVPLVAFDKYGNRLGMGGGFYDHTLKYIHHSKKNFLIGLAHDCQKINCIIPTSNWDITLPEIITPNFHYYMH